MSKWNLALSPAKLVLNTVIKMQKNEFCLNFYTNGRNTNLISKGIIATYDIPDRNGVSTNPDYINTGFHNVTKYSNGQCIYSIQAFIYTTSLVDCTIGNIPNDYMHIRQDVYSYCYDMTGNRFLLIRITPQGIVRLETLNGSTIPQSEVRMRGSIVF